MPLALDNSSTANLQGRPNSHLALVRSLSLLQTSGPTNHYGPWPPTWQAVASPVTARPVTTQTFCNAAAYSLQPTVVSTGRAHWSVKRAPCAVRKCALVWRVGACLSPSVLLAVQHRKGRVVLVVAVTPRSASN